MLMRISIVFSLLCLIPAVVWSQQFIFPSHNKSECKDMEKEKLQSILFELVTSDNKEKFAKEHDIFLYEGKVKVFILFDQASSQLDREKVSEFHHIVIEKKSDNVARTLVPIDELIPLSKESVVSSISIPAKPIIQ